MTPGFFSREELKGTGGGPRLSCLSCGLYREALSPKMPPSGEGREDILVCGEAPGKEEDKVGKQWQGRAGRLLQRAFRDSGLSLFRDAWVTNAVNCRPPGNRTPKDHELNCCRKVILKPALEDLRPRLVLLLGLPATVSFLVPHWGEKEFGKIGRWRGWAIPDYERGAWLCPTYHPSFILRADTEEVRTVWDQDMDAIFSYVDKPLPPRVDDQVTILRSESDVDTVLRRVRRGEEGRWISFDYETTGLKPQAADHRIICVSLATATNTYAFMYPRSRSVATQWKRILQSVRIGKVAHNLGFEDTWSRVVLGTRVRQWVWCSMHAAHVLDNRAWISGLKFQVFVNFGVAGYDEPVQPYIQAPEEEVEEFGANGYNRMEDMVREGRGDELLRYCGLDSLYGRLLAKSQAKQMGVDWLEG